MTISVPKSLARLALEIEGWLELRRPDQALAKLEPLLEVPGARPAGLYFKARALVESNQHERALEAMCKRAAERLAEGPLRQRRGIGALYPRT